MSCTRILRNPVGGMLLLLLIVSPLLAGGYESWAAPGSKIPDVPSAGKLCGMSVRNSQDEILGTMKDLVINLDQDQPAYAVCSFGGIMGLGEKYYAVPWSALHRSADQQKLILDLPKETLSQIPTFDQNNWPNMTDPQWIANLSRFYSSHLTSPKTALPTMSVLRPQTNLKRFSELTGMEVRDRQGVKMGTLKDVALDLEWQNVAYAFVAFNGLMSMGEKMAPIPFEALNINPQLNTAQVDVTRQTLQDIAFTPEQTPNFSDRQYAADLHERFDLQPYWLTHTVPTATAMMPPSAAMTASSLMLHRGNDLIGMTVQNPQGQKTGRIEEVILDLNRNQLCHAILSCDKMTPQSNKLFPVPWALLRLNPDASAFMVNLSESQVEQAPGFLASHWPEFSDPEWSHDIDMFYQKHTGAPAARDMAPMRRFMCRRLTATIGLPVSNEQGENLGTIENVVIDLREGVLAYGILSLPFAQTPQNMATVPWNSFDIQPWSRQARLDANRSMLEQVAFTENNYPQFSDPQYGQRIYRQFNQQPYWQVYGYVMGERTDPAAAWQAQSPYLQSFNPGRIQTLDATVLSVGTFRPQTDAAPGLRLRVQTSDGKSHIVHAGPQAYAADQGFRFYTRDQITIKAAPAQFEGDTVFIASEIQRQNQKLQLCDHQGKPLWNLDQLRQSSY